MSVTKREVMENWELKSVRNEKTVLLNPPLALLGINSSRFILEVADKKASRILHLSRNDDWCSSGYHEVKCPFMHTSASKRLAAWGQMFYAYCDDGYFLKPPSDKRNDDQYQISVMNYPFKGPISIFCYQCRARVFPGDILRETVFPIFFLIYPQFSALKEWHNNYVTVFIGFNGTIYQKVKKCYFHIMFFIRGTECWNVSFCVQQKKNNRICFWDYMRGSK